MTIPQFIAFAPALIAAGAWLGANIAWRLDKRKGRR